jgi:hypothetical protein
VSCLSAKVCIAVGNYDTGSSAQKTLAERWNGTRWKIQPTPKSTTSSEVALNGVSCSSPARSIAVGYHWITERRIPAEGSTRARDERLLAGGADVTWLADTTSALAHAETYLLMRETLQLTPMRYKDWLAQRGAAWR